MASAALIVMVSGGSDSTALLELCALAARGGQPAGPVGRRLLDMLTASLPAACRPLPLCLHVNHQLRGEDSEADQAFVEQLCSRLGIPCEPGSFHIRGLIPFLCHERSSFFEFRIISERIYKIKEKLLCFIQRLLNPVSGLISLFSEP